MTTGTFELNIQIAEVRVHALAHACFGNPDNAHTALAFKLQLLQFPAEIPVQRLYLICGRLSAQGANLVLGVAEKGGLFLQTKDFIAPIAHHWVKGEEEAKGAEEVINQLGFFSVNCVCLVKSCC